MAHGHLIPASVTRSSPCLNHHLVITVTDFGETSRLADNSGQWMIGGLTKQHSHVLYSNKGMIVYTGLG